jgi:hypothetical protein
MVSASLRSLPFKSIFTAKSKERKERQENQTCILRLSILRVLAVKILGFGGFF